MKKFPNKSNNLNRDFDFSNDISRTFLGIMVLFAHGWND